MHEGSEGCTAFGSRAGAKSVPPVPNAGYPAATAGKSKGEEPPKQAGGKTFTLRNGAVVPAIGMGTFTGTRCEHSKQTTSKGEQTHLRKTGTQPTKEERQSQQKHLQSI